MCKFKTLGVSWPPKGWAQFKDLEESYGQAILKDPASALITGLSYEVEPVPVHYENKENSYIYHIDIRGWDYNIYNESCEYSVLSFMLKERTDTSEPKHLLIHDVKAQAQRVDVNTRSAHRTFMAALFFMKQIAAGHVPDTNRVLKLYKIHPLQRDLRAEEKLTMSSKCFINASEISSLDDVI